MQIGASVILGYLCLLGVDFLLPALNCFQQFLRVRVICKVVSHWLQEIVDSLRDGWLQVTRVQITADESGLELSISLEGYIAAILLSSRDRHLTRCWEQNVSTVVQYRVISDDLRRTVSLLNFFLYVLSTVLHKDSGEWIRLAHLCLAFLKTHKHVMRDNNWFVRFVNFVAVVLRKRVYFSLVQAELADISL